MGRENIMLMLGIGLLLALFLAGCSTKMQDVEQKIRQSQMKMPDKPKSCTQRTEYPKIVRQCRQQACKVLAKRHCKGGLDDVASASWLSCVKEELLVSGANRDDCRLFIYDLEAVMNGKR